jgi:hypothetical protein
MILSWMPLTKLIHIFPFRYVRLLHLFLINKFHAFLIFQMILVFISALVLKIYATSFVVLLVACNSSTNFRNFLDFILFNMLIAVPSIIAIYMGYRVSIRGNQFAAYVGKYASHCDDEISYRKVSGFV